MKNKINQLDEVDIYRAFPLIRAEYIFSSRTHHLLKTDHMLGHRTSLNKFQRIQAIQIMFSGPNRINLGINVQVSRKPPNIGKVSYTPKQLMGQRRNQRVFWTEWKRDTTHKNCSQMFSFLVWGKETFYNLGTRVTFAQGWSANSFWLRSVPQSVLRRTLIDWGWSKGQETGSEWSRSLREERMKSVPVRLNKSHSTSHRKEKEPWNSRAAHRKSLKV